MGVVTDRDLVVRAVADGDFQAKLADVCSDDVVTCSPEMSTSDAAELMIVAMYSRCTSSCWTFVIVRNLNAVNSRIPSPSLTTLRNDWKGEPRGRDGDGERAGVGARGDLGPPGESQRLDIIPQMQFIQCNRIIDPRQVGARHAQRQQVDSAGQRAADQAGQERDLAAAAVRQRARDQASQKGDEREDADHQTDILIRPAKVVPDMRRQ